MITPIRRRLLDLVPPPSRPPAAVDWAAARRALGVELPDGYRWLAETYGPGLFDEWLKFHVPGADWFDLVATTQRKAEMTRFSIEDPLTVPYPYPVFPEPGGLVFWGATYDTDVLAWATAGDPEDWPVIIQEFETLGTQRYDGPTQRVLLELLEGTIDLGLRDPDPHVPPLAFEPEPTPDTGPTGLLPLADSIARSGLRKGRRLAGTLRRGPSSDH